MLLFMAFPPSVCASLSRMIIFFILREEIFSAFFCKAWITMFKLNLINLLVSLSRTFLKILWQFAMLKINKICNNWQINFNKKKTKNSHLLRQQKKWIGKNQKSWIYMRFCLIFFFFIVMLRIHSNMLSIECDEYPNINPISSQSSF